MTRRVRLNNLANSVDSNELLEKELRSKSRGLALDTRNMSLNVHSGSEKKGHLTFKKLRSIMDEEKKRGRKSPRFLKSNEEVELSEDENLHVRDDEVSLQ